MAQGVYRLDGKKCLVTGASRGIGQAIAKRLAEEGCDIVIDYLKSPESADDTRKMVESAGRKTLLLQADMSKLNEVCALIDQATKQLGPIDFLVNNAGIEKNTPFLDVAVEDYSAVIAVNLTGPFFLTQYFARHLKEAKRPGRVVNISSVHEELPFPHFAPYCVSKGGLKMMMRTLAIELAPLGITINNIAPGAIKTPINKALLGNKAELRALEAKIPLGRMGESSDVAGVCAFLLSDDASYVTGATYFVDGGLTWNYSEQ